MTSTVAIRDSQRPLTSTNLGPWPHCRALIWEHLVDFSNWPSWCSLVSQAQRLDTGAPGRGSRLQVTLGSANQVWEVIYWEPGLRLDFEIQRQHLRCGFSFQIESGDDPAYARLNLYMETRKQGNPLLGHFQRRQLQAQAKKFMREFSAILNQSPSLAN